MQYRKIALKETENKFYTKDSLLNRLLSSRGFKNESEVEKFLNPSKKDLISPFVFSDMQKTLDRINLAIEKQEKILIWGDFDCDGVTSTVILFKTLKKLKANVIKFIPDRLLDGHGLKSKTLINFIAKEKIKLVITVDCGISNINEINLLKGFKIDTIITDHHAIDKTIPDAFAIINPQVTGAIKEDTSIEDITSLSYNSGSVVAYKLAMALLKDVDDEKLKEELLIISSCGLIADIVPVLGENRAMVNICLELLNTKKENSFKPVYKLLNKTLKERLITSTDIAFVLAPRINAVGRLANAELSFEFLMTDEDTKLDIIIEKLDNYNAIRQSKCVEIFDEIKEHILKNKEELNNPAIILINKDWHIGIIGIVAAKVVEEFNKPCFLMTIDDNNFARCSIRSNELINVYQTIAQNERFFAGFGGHKLAGGFSFDLNNVKFEDVKTSLLETIKEEIKDKKLENVLKADVELDENDLDVSLFETLNKLEPFGEGNKMPVFSMFDVELKETKIIGKEANHLSFVFSKNGKEFKGLKWSETECLAPLNSKVDIAFCPKLNSFNGVESVQVELFDMYSPVVESLNKTKDFKLFDHRKKTGILKQISSYLEKENLDIKIWAKTPKTKEILSEFENIKNNIINDEIEHNGLMFFDYPSTEDEFNKILKSIRPKKIHFMNHKVDENIENYVKQLNGMIKYCSSKLNGSLELEKMSFALGVDVEFIQLTLEILESLESVEIIDIDKIKYLKPFSYEDFKNNSMFEMLKEEFEKITNFKKNLLNCEFKELEELVESVF